MNIPPITPVKHPIISVKTPRATSTFTLLNPRRLAVTVLEPEQFFPIGELNCDFVFQAPEAPAEIYVELKGSNFPHALDQLAHTMRLLKSSLRPKHCFVVIRRSPSMDAKMQRLLLDFGRRNNCTIRTKTQHCEHYI
ncbi:hypothetical protein [Hymenobacter rubripertinctus]|uniref:Uncharacterized protein n=1 Tax=Hymenobacter rubripertinctus TaxID=2029981 RepID=A0A418QUG1_9BACT|nr:hypothetical protein [Hymenobacter rubripertinctus]RIY08763.1 hypothetical protein D0T11_13585 [Hymenobacter rubripertinctus]